MSDSIQITVRGRVGTEPDLLVTANGREVTRFRLGATRSYRDATGEWREDPTEWFTVKAWGAAGAQIRQSLHRGMPVIVQGRLSSEEWTSGERTNHTNVINATAIGVDIKYGIVTYHRVAKVTPAEAERADTAAPDGPGEEAVQTPDPDDPDAAGPEPVSVPAAADLSDWERVDADG